MRVVPDRAITQGWLAFVAMAIAAWPWPVSGQTIASPPPPAHLFRCSTLPLVQRAPPVGEPAATPQAPPANAPVVDPPQPPAMPSLRADAELAALSPYQQKQLQWVMSQWGAPAPDPADAAPYQKALGIVFPEPVDVRARNVIFSGGIITALKTGNPFGLLRPDVLILSF